MRKFSLITGTVIIFIMSMLISPPILNADYVAPIKFDGNGHYYELRVDLSWEDARVMAESLGGYLATVTSPKEDEFICTTFGTHADDIWLGGFQPPGTVEPDGGWQWVTGETWSFTNWYSGEPNDGFDNEDVLYLRSGTSWNDTRGSEKYHYLVEYGTPGSGEKVVEPEPIPWVRDRGMTCYQVWINQDNNFEFVFWWEYANNNWVKIYDMAGNEVFSIDMPYGAANFVAELPDGIYTVKTFHNGFETPIQEFVIGKP